MDGMTISILNFNGGNVLNECIEAILKSELPPHTEIQIVDNASTDGSAEKAFHHYSVDSLIHCDNKDGFITGVNASFRYAKYDTVLFLSYDVIVEAGICGAYELYFGESPLKAIVQPTIYELNGKVQNTGQRWQWPGYGVTLKNTSGPIDMFTTTAFMMTQQAFQEIGPFDSDFAPAYYENVDYALRARRLGYKFYCSPHFKVRHYTSLAFSKRYQPREILRYYQENRKKVIRKHYKGLDKQVRLTTLSVLDFIRGVLP